MKMRLSSQFARSSGWLLPVDIVVVCSYRLSRQLGFLCTSWASPGLLLPSMASAGASAWEGSSPCWEAGRGGTVSWEGCGQLRTCLRLECGRDSTEKGRGRRPGAGLGDETGLLSLGTACSQCKQAPEVYLQTWKRGTKHVFSCGVLFSSLYYSQMGLGMCAGGRNHLAGTFSAKSKCLLECPSAMGSCSEYL